MQSPDEPRHRQAPWESCDESGVADVGGVLARGSVKWLQKSEQLSVQHWDVHYNTHLWSWVIYGTRPCDGTLPPGSHMSHHCATADVSMSICTSTATFHRWECHRHLVCPHFKAPLVYVSTASLM
jgi:hypothetical protein